MTIYLKLSGTKEEQTAALKAAHPDMIAKNKAGEDELRSIYTHDIAMEVFDQLTVTPAVYSDTEVDEDGFPIVLEPAVTDGPFVMVWFLDDQKLPGSLPAELTKVWEAGGAPVVWAGT